MKKTGFTSSFKLNKINIIFAICFEIFFAITCIAQVDTIDYSFQNFQLTKDPALGYPPYNRLNIIREKISQNQTATGAIPNISWYERGPNNIGGRTRAIMFDPHISASNNYKKVWAGGVGGGLWWTNDITSSQPQWNKVNDLWDDLSVSAITNDKFSTNNDEYYCGTGEGWQMPQTISNIIPPSGNGIWKSADGGLTWNHLNSTVKDDFVNNPNGYNFDYIQKIECKQVLGQIRGDVYVATKDNGLLRSQDGGTTWDIVLGHFLQSNTNEVSDIEIGADNSGVSYIYAALGMNYAQAGIYYSITGDPNSWILISGPGSGIQQGFHRVNLCTSKTNPNKIYALVNYIGGTKLYVCSTVGTLNQWNLMPTLPLGYSISNVASNSSFNQAIGIDPLNDQTIYIGSTDIYKSIDGGITFQKITSYSGTGLPNVHEGQNEILVSSKNPSSAVICNNGGVYYSDDFSISYPQFYNKNQTYNVTQLYTCAMKNLPSSSYYLAGPQDFPNLSSISPGISNVIELEKNNRIGAMCFIDQSLGQSNIQIISERYTDAFKYSTNGGGSWTPFNSIPQTNCEENFISPADYDSRENTLFFLNLQAPINPTGDECDYSYIARYTNVGFSNLRSELNIFWTGIPFNLYNKQDIKITHIKVLPNNLTPNTSTLFIGTSLGYVFKIPNIPNNSQNLNLVAYPILTPLFGSAYRAVSSIDIGQDEDHILVTFSNFGISSVFETKNGGATWQDKDNINLNTTLPDMPIYWGMYNPYNFNQVLLATELGVWSTDDISANPVQWGFDPNSGIPKVRVYQLRTRTSDNLILAATHGRGLWATDIFNQPIAGFNYSQPTPCSLHYEFTNTSVPANCTYLWDFGDGSTSTVANPTHVYGSPGIYVVNLTVTNNSGNNTSSQTINIDLSSCCSGDVYLEDGRNASDYLSDLNGFATTFIVKGKFTFDNSPGVNGMNLSGKDFIAMPGAEIIVEDFVKITATNCHFYACSDMWKGITTKSGSTIYFDNCSINDADKGIAPYFQANFEIRNCTFTNDIYGIYADNDIGFPAKEGYFAVTGSTFDFSSPLKLSYASQPAYGTHPKTGIYMHLRHGNLGDNNLPQNYFYNLNTGITLFVSSISVNNATFDEIHNEGFYPEDYMGSAIYGESFGTLNLLIVDGYNGSSTSLINIKNSDVGVYTHDIRAIASKVVMTDVGVGVYGEANTNLKNLTVTNCSIHASTYGVHFNTNPGAQTIYIAHNEIYTTASDGVCILAEQSIPTQTNLEILENSEIHCMSSAGGIWATNFDGGLIKWNNVTETGAVQRNFAGILLTGCNKTEVSCNNVQGSGISGGQESNSIKIDQSSISTIHCNTVNNTDYGIGFYGSCPSTDMADNEIQNHDVGLHLNVVGITGDQIQQGNQWVGSYLSGFGAVNLNPAFILSKFQVHTPQGTTYFPIVSPNPLQPPLWFSTVLGGIPYNCDNLDECNPDPINRMVNSNYNLEEAIAQGIPLTTEFIPESKKINEQYLYSRLDKDAAMLNQNIDFQSFYSTHQNTNIGKLELVSDDLKNTTYYDNYFKNAMNSVELIIKTTLDSLHKLDSLRLIYSNDSLIDSTIVIVKSNLITAQKAAEQIIQQQALTSSSNLQNAQTINSLVISNEIPEQNKKIVNTIYFETIGSDIFEFTSSQINNLLPIAQQCPYSGGSAVYSARVMLELAKENLDYDDFTVCWSQGIYRKADIDKNISELSTNTNSNIRISPNPANETVRIQYDGFSNGVNQLEMFDVSGRKVLEKLLPSATNNFTFSLKDLPNGAYQMRMLNNNQIIHNEKLIIIK